MPPPTRSSAKGPTMPKLSSDMQYLIKYLDDKLQSNTDAILKKID